MNRKIRAKLAQKLAQIDKTKKAILALRDTLRAQTEDLSHIIKSCDDAVGDIEDGLETIENAVNCMSAYL